MNPFASQLAELCRTHVTRSKWVFVPSHAVGHTLGERVALAGTNWLNLRFVTPLDIALRMGAPFLVERGVDPSEEGLGPALMMRLLLALPERDGYFRPLADQPTMAEALWRTIRELRMARVKAVSLKAEAFASAHKHAELHALLEAYEQFLVANTRGDMALVYEEAARHPEWSPIQPGDCWTELPDTRWDSSERRLMDAMPGERIDPRAWELRRVATPRRLHSGTVRVSPDPARNRFACVMDPAAVPRVVDERIALFHAGGREAEIEEVVRRILAAGAPLDQVEIACASDALVALAWEKALRHDWPVTLGPGIAGTQTRPGRALLGLCDWIETDFSAGHLRRLLQSGDLGVDAETVGFTAGQAAAMIARAGAGWGRDTYAISLGQLRKAYESRAADPDKPEDDREAARSKADSTTRVNDWVQGLLAAIPQPDARQKVSLLAVVDAVIHFLDQSTARRNALDHRAAAALVEYVEELRALDQFSCTLVEALRFIRERVEALSVAPERPRPGHLYVSALGHSSHSGRAHLFVVGLEEGRVFPTATEDPVLLDSERMAISSSLQLSSDKVDEAVHAVLSRLAAWDGTRVTLSYSCRDTREFRETYASWLMLQAFRLQQGNPTASYPQMRAHLGEPASMVASDQSAASSGGSWWLRGVVGAAEAGVNAVTATFAGVARGRHAAEQRESDVFTEYDGNVPEAGPVLDPCASGTAYSVTTLQNAAACPFRFFLERGLGIQSVEDDDRDKDVWLDPLTRGAELHELYASLLRRCRDAGRRPSEKKDRAWFTSRAEERLAALNCEMPAATSEILHRESQEFLADVELFFEAECEPTTASTVGIEVSFGRPLDGEEEPLARAEPVEIDLGQGLILRIAGRIDRIDHLGDRAGTSEFEVLDYKTGGFWRDAWTGTFAGGRRLQHALYGLAAVELLRSRYRDPKVVAGVYYFSGRKGRKERVRIAAPGQEAIAAVLADLRDVIMAGRFVHTATKDDCKFCDYGGACDQSHEGRAEGKLEDAVLRAYGRLRVHG